MSAGNTTDGPMCGAHFHVQSATYDPLHIHARIDAALGVLEQKVGALSDDDFASYVAGERALLESKPRSLNEESNWYWGEIIAREYRFDRVEYHLAALSALNKARFVTLLGRLLHSPGHGRRLYTRVFAESQRALVGLPPREMTTVPSMVSPEGVVPVPAVAPFVFLTDDTGAATFKQCLEGLPASGFFVVPMVADR